MALITGGDSWIGRSVAVHMAREGAEIAIVYLEEDDDAADTAHWVEAEGRRCLTIRGDVSQEEFCKNAVGKVLEEFGHIDVLVNNAAEQHLPESDNPLDISQDQLRHTSETNVFGYFMSKVALSHLKDGAEEPPKMCNRQIERGLAYLWERRERRLRRVRIMNRASIVDRTFGRFPRAIGSPPMSIRRMSTILPNTRSATDFIDSNGTVTAAIISVGGFLGVGQMS